MDKASPHYKSKKVLKYFEENKDTSNTGISSNYRITRIYGNGRDMEHSQTDLFVLKYYNHLQILKTKYRDISEQKDSILI